MPSRRQPRRKHRSSRSSRFERKRVTRFDAIHSRNTFVSIDWKFRSVPFPVRTARIEDDPRRRSPASSLSTFHKRVYIHLSLPPDQIENSSIAFYSTCPTSKVESFVHPCIESTNIPLPFDFAISYFPPYTDPLFPRYFASFASLVETCDHRRDVVKLQQALLVFFLTFRLYLLSTRAPPS